jgi:hypothetical protein
MDLKSLIVWGMGIFSQLFIIKYLFIKTIRLKNSQIKHIHDITIKNNGFKFIINETVVDKENEHMMEFSGVFKLKNLPPFYFFFGERLLTAGYSSKEDIGSITYFRWNNKQIKNLIKNINNNKIFLEERLNIYTIEGDNFAYLGSINKNNHLKIKSCVSPVENDIIRMEKGEIVKTSALLYGEPGNGKTTAIRELAKKYGYNIYFVSFNKDLKNVSILSGLSYVHDKSFIVFEDFDSVFNKRDVLNFEKPNFTFDSILNSLDGIYNNYNKVCFFITCNDINKIDDAIKNRPSRMKHKIYFTNPTKEEIFEILKDYQLTELAYGLNTDQIYMIKDMLLIQNKEYIIKYINENKTLNINNEISIQLNLNE